MTYDARRAVLDEQKAWVEACLASLCSAYGATACDRHIPIGSPRLDEICNHAWCHGIVDVLNRAYCNPHVSYRIPEVSDAAKVPA